jgi:hypothetical protein
MSVQVCVLLSANLCGVMFPRSGCGDYVATCKYAVL